MDPEGVGSCVVRFIHYPFAHSNTLKFTGFLWKAIIRMMYGGGGSNDPSGTDDQMQVAVGDNVRASLRENSGSGSPFRAADDAVSDAAGSAFLVFL